VNERARDLAVVLRGVLGTLPGATAIGLHTARASAYLLILTATNAAVQTLGHDLALDAPELRGTRAAWWLRARSEAAFDQGALSLEVVGPHRRPAASRR